MGVMFLTSAVVSFNAAVWQVVRRGKKKELMDNQKNLMKEPLHQIPDELAPPASKIEFQRVELDGTMDNEGSVLVGPRPIPSHKGAVSSDEAKGGFLVMTPFEIAETKQFIMVNRGWVPIDAAKHRMMLAQYIGEGFKPMTVRGVFKKEEFMASFYGSESADNVGPLSQDLSWLALRPWNMAKAYFEARWGADQVAARSELHGLRHYYVEMLEDFSGDDQRMARGKAWPRRRDTDELTYVHLTPIVHSMYAFFWGAVSVGSLYGMRKCFLRQKDLFAQRKRMMAQCTALEAKRQKEAKAFFDASQDVLKRQQQKK
jgi:cytochrome oxidase assembly protein ShyY1